MKSILAVLLLLISCTSLALDIFTRDGKMYQDVKIKVVESEGIRIIHRDGTAFVDFDLLPYSIQRQYGWTAEKSAVRKAGRIAAAEAKRVAAENATAEEEIRNSRRKLLLVGGLLTLYLLPSFIGRKNRKIATLFGLNLLGFVALVALGVIVSCFQSGDLVPYIVLIFSIAVWMGAMVFALIGEKKSA